MKNIHVKDVCDGTGQVSDPHDRGGHREPHPRRRAAGLHPIGGEPLSGRAGEGAGLCGAETKPRGGQAHERGRAPAARGAGLTRRGGAAQANGVLDPGARIRHSAHRGLHLGGRALAAADFKGVSARLSEGGLSASKRRLSRCGAVAHGRERGCGLCDDALPGGLRVHPADGGQAACDFAKTQPL